AGLAAPARDVEAERAGGVAALSRRGERGEDAPDLVERFHVRDGIRARRLADGTLIDEHDVFQRLVAGEAVVRAHLLAEVLLGRMLARELGLVGAHQDVVYARALAAGTDAGDR